MISICCEGGSGRTGHDGAWRDIGSLQYLMEVIGFTG